MELDQVTRAIVEALYPYQSLSINQLAAKTDLDPLLFSEPVNFLLTNGFIWVPTSLDSPNGLISLDTLFELTSAGRAFWENTQSTKRAVLIASIRDWGILVISIFSLILGILNYLSR